MRASGNMAGSVIAFGKHLERKPQVVIRVLRMFEGPATNDELHVEAITGKRGVHWEYREELGIVILPD